MIQARRMLRALGPAVARPALREMLRTALGAGLGIAGCAFVAEFVRPGIGLADMPLLIAPLGASAFLIYGVPNSPLAQPWSALVGNTISAVVAILVSLLIAPVPAGAAVAVALSAFAMMALRAMHPPGAAVALLIALTPAVARDSGLTYALAPVALGTMVLVVIGILFNRLTGRKYPFRQPPDQSPHGTRDVAPERRLGLSADDLMRILSGMNLAANIGPEDLARLIGAAEAEAAARHIGGLTALDVMSRDLVTIGPDAHPHEIAELFRKRGFKTLPVVSDDGAYLGLLSQTALLEVSDERVEAEQLMSVAHQTARPDTPISELLQLLADGRQQVVAVLNGRQLVGIVSRTDMIGALAHVLGS